MDFDDSFIIMFIIYSVIISYHFFCLLRDLMAFILILLLF